MYATTEAEFTASGTADIFIDRYIPLWGCPVTLLSDIGRQLCSKISRALYERLGINNHHQCLPPLNQRRRRARQSHDGPDARHGSQRTTNRLGRAIPTRGKRMHNSVNAATGLAPNEVHIGRLPFLPFTIVDLPNIGGHQRLNRDQLACFDRATGRRQRAYRTVREHHAVTVSRLDRRNAPILDALRRSPPFTAGG